MNQVEFKVAVKQSGFPAKTATTLYTQVFAVAKKDPTVKKTAAGYALKA